MREPDHEADAQYYREKSDRLERERERESQERWEAECERRRQREVEYRESQCYADTWGEAFNKAIPRLQGEADEEAVHLEWMKENEPDRIAHAREGEFDYFARATEQHRFARDAYNTRIGAVSEQMSYIRKMAEQMIEALEQEAREAAAADVEAKFGDCFIVENLRNNDINSVVNW